MCQTVRLADLKQELLAAGYGIAGEAEALQRDTDGRPVLGARTRSPRRRRQTRGQQPQRTPPQLLPNQITIISSYAFPAKNAFPAKKGGVRLQTRCRQKLPKSYPLLDSPDPSKTQSIMGMVHTCQAECQLTR